MLLLFRKDYVLTAHIRVQLTETRSVLLASVCVCERSYIFTQFTHSYPQGVLVKVRVVPGAAVVAPGAAVVAPVTDTHTRTQGYIYTCIKVYFQNTMRMIHHSAHMISNDKASQRSLQYRKNMWLIVGHS